MTSEGNPLVDNEFPIQKGVTMASAPYILTLLENPKRIRVHALGTGEAFQAPLHWHAAHDERHTVIKGRFEITQDGISRIVGPEDGVVTTPRGVVHSLRSFEGEEAIIEESALPSETTTEQKQIFFRNMFTPGILPSFLAIMQVFYYGDSYPAFPRGFRWLETSPLSADHHLPDKSARKWTRNGFLRVRTLKRIEGEHDQASGSRPGDVGEIV
ncbi:hypothetical protein FIBSPDRAFT_923902 [Athelia psychrophila]|uniref:Uncharacterized protein n=1 Tax=Athelia psychrophila TaxID=1759441 RepID=A0A166X321_9AGAM|nr:hypothetical protein FIBSPDRAFT_923902 [Fibularhizoctonia sp. CBS 109695]